LDVFQPGGDIHHGVPGPRADLINPFDTHFGEKDVEGPARLAFLVFKLAGT